MNQVSLAGPHFIKRVFTALAVTAFAAGGVASALFATAAYANNGLTVDAVPSSGTLVPGQSLEVDFHDPSGTTDAVATSCLVNGVETASTFANVSPGLYKVVYTVGASDQSQAAGQVPINCTLKQQKSVTVTAFDDNNTVAIDTTATSTDSTGGGTGTSTSATTTNATMLSNGTAADNGGLTVSASPNTGTLTPGQALTVEFGDPSGTTDAVSSTCLVNGVEASSTFSNVSPGLYKVVYTVGASDQSRTAGNIPIDCTVSQQNSVHVVTFTDGNTTAIDTAGSSSGSGSTGGTTGTTTGSGDTTATTTGPLSFSSVSLSPHTGTSTKGDLLHAFFQEASGAADLAVAGSCMVNAVDVSQSLTNLGSGLYQVAYTVGPNDGERPSGHVPITCTLGDSARGTVAAHAWTDGNTLSIDTNGDGTIDNGTSTLGFTVTASPNTGTLHIGDALHVSIQDPLPSGDVIITPSSGCRVNGADVASTYAYHGNGLYSVDYTVGQSDPSEPAGQIPFDCRLQNATGSVHLTYFTDGNAVAVDATASGTGSTTGSTTTASGMFSSVSAVPASGTLHAGDTLQALFTANNGVSNLVLNGACRINGVESGSTFQNLGGGQYRVTYTVGSSDAERAAGQVPINCAFANPYGGIETVKAFTQSDTVAIDSNDDGSITPPAGADSDFMSTVMAGPHSGTLTTGQTLDVTMQDGLNDPSFAVGSCAVNGVDVSNTFANLTDGQYRVTYTVGANDQSRAAGQIPVDCTLHNGEGQTISTTFGFTDSNTVSIDVPTSTTTGSTGNTGDTGGTGTTTASTTISFTSVTADPSNGTLHQGSHVLVYLQEAHNAADIVEGESCTVNNVPISSFQNIGNGLYRLDYTIGLTDADRPAGTLPIDCELSNSSGATARVTSFTDANAVAIDAADDGIGSSVGGNVNGTVTGGQDAALAVSAIDPVSTTAVAGGGYDHGWAWVLHVTVPSNETHLSMKFSDWTHTNGSSHLSAAGNMRISSPQASSTEPVSIDAADTYSAPITLTGDMDPATPGRQIEVKVEMQVPSSVLDGSYSTSYGIRTQ